MLKGLIVCFAVLFAQLAVLHLVDTRYNASHDVRQTALTNVTAHKDKKDDDEEVQG